MSNSLSEFFISPGGFIVVAILVTTLGSFFYRLVRRNTIVQDGPDDGTYKVYSREFDRVVSSSDVAHALLTSPDKAKGWLEDDPNVHDGQISKATEIFERCDGAELRSILTELGYGPETSFTLLVDQSGSLKGEAITSLAAASRVIMAVLAENDIQCELLGFSTFGWHGGQARQHWLANGQPARPGRLASLFHIIYKPFNHGTLEQADWRVMLNPDILRENIDSEALQWAAARLLAQPAKRKILVLISDGAPVDDSTQSANGPRYLGRHLRDVIASLESDTKIRLGAIGLNYDVSGFFKNSEVAHNAEDIIAGVAKLLRVVQAV